MSKLFLIISLLGSSVFAQIDKSFYLIARNTGEQIMPNDDTIRVMGFAEEIDANVTFPGPTLIMNEGDSVEIELFNFSQGAPHTIHLHGLDVDQANDGVPMFSFDIPHLESGFYYFKAPHPGAYLYHCHVASPIHVQGGMFGVILVRSADGSQTTWDGGYDYDVTTSLMMNEVDTVWHNDTIIKHDYDTSMTMPMVMIPKYEPQFFMVNGLADGQIADSNLMVSTSVGAVAYVQLLNIGNYGNRLVFPPDFGAQIISSDGRPLPAVEVSDTVWMFPGERYGVLGTMDEEGIEMIEIDYVNMNTGVVEGSQEVPIVTQGFVSTKESEGNDLKIWPNPSTKEVVVKLEKNLSQGVLNVINLQGQLIFSTHLEEGSEFLLNVSNIPSGTYVILVRDDVGNIFQEKLLVE